MAAAPAPPRPRLADIERRAHNWLTGRQGSAAAWEQILDAASVNLRHGFAGAIAAASQLQGAADPAGAPARRLEPVATPAEWKAAGWAAAPGQPDPVWVGTGRGLRRASLMLPRSRVAPARPGPPLPAVPGAADAVPDEDLPALLAAFARTLGYEMSAEPPGPGSPQAVICVPDDSRPALRAALTAHHLAHIQFGEPAAMAADCVGMPAIIADSAAWVVLRSLGADPAEAGLRFPPPSHPAWPPGFWSEPYDMTAAGAKVVQAARPVIAHARRLRAQMPAPAAARPLPARSPGRPADQPPGPAPAATYDFVITDQVTDSYGDGDLYCYRRPLERGSLAVADGERLEDVAAAHLAGQAARTRRDTSHVEMVVYPPGEGHRARVESVSYGALGNTRSEWTEPTPVCRVTAAQAAAANRARPLAGGPAPGAPAQGRLPAAADATPRPAPAPHRSRPPEAAAPTRGQPQPPAGRPAATGDAPPSGTTRKTTTGGRRRGKPPPSTPRPAQHSPASLPGRPRQPEPATDASEQDPAAAIAALCQAGRHTEAAGDLGRLAPWLIPAALARLSPADLIKVHQVLAAPPPGGGDPGPAIGLARDACVQLLTPPSTVLSLLCHSGRHEEAARNLSRLPSALIAAAAADLDTGDLVRLHRILAGPHEHAPSAAQARRACAQILARIPDPIEAVGPIASLCRKGRHGEAASELSHLPEALLLAAAAGLDTKSLIKVHQTLSYPAGQDRDRGPTAGQAREACARILIPQVNEAAAAWFTAQLPGSWAEGYLEGRGVSAAIRRQWELGYAPASAGGAKLLGELRRQGWGDALAEAAGLSRRPRGGALEDTFRNRVMIPIRDSDGTLVAFAGRKQPQPSWVRTPEQQDKYREVPKYLNTETNVVYAKGALLYGLHQAGPVLAEGGSPVLVEGYFDVWAVNATGAGRLAGVAPCGTELTIGQMEALDRTARQQGRDPRDVPVLAAWDDDPAGRKAARKSYLRIAPWFPHPRAASGLPRDADPAEVFEKDGPAALYRALTGHDHPLADIAVDAVLDDWDYSSTRPRGGPLGGRLTRETETAAQAVYAVARLLADASAPADEVRRQVARTSDRIGSRLPWSFVDWAARRETDPSCPREPPWPANEPSDRQVLAMAQSDERKTQACPAPSRDTTATAPVTAFPGRLGGRAPRRPGGQSRLARAGPDPPAGRPRAR